MEPAPADARAAPLAAETADTAMDGSVGGLSPSLPRPPPDHPVHQVGRGVGKKKSLEESATP
eukprot:scaffold21660_cov101-Isochrysis_galbana.AAC.1